MRWVELKKYNSGGTILVNMELASSMERAKTGNRTLIWFSAGHVDGQVAVQETPQAILALLEESPVC